jgi:hypothetical protein
MVISGSTRPIKAIGAPAQQTSSLADDKIFAEYSRPSTCCPDRAMG